MTTSFVILCPECEKQMNVKEELIGKKIRCKACEHIFVVKKPKNLPKPAAEDDEIRPKKAKDQAPRSKVEEESLGSSLKEVETFKLKDEPKEEKKPAAKPVTSDDDDENADPYAIAQTNDFVARCPFCTSELESEKTVICKECGYNMVTRKRHETAKVHEPTPHEVMMWRLPGFICVFTMVLLIVLSVLCFVKTKTWMKDSWFEEEETGAGGKKSYYVKPGCFQLFNVMLTGYLCFQCGKFAYKRLLVNNLPPEQEIEEGDAELAAEAEAELGHDDDD